MVIRGASKAQIETALETANKTFDNNLRFKTFGEIGNDRQGKPKFTVTLTVVNSRKPGSRISHMGRRISAACWHAHGVFMDSLPDSATIDTGQQRGINPGDAWVDWNAGSQAYPASMSSLCDCGV